MMRLSLLLALSVSACASGAGAPISYGGGGQSAAAPAPSRSRAPIERREERSPPAAATPAHAPVQQEAPDWADGEGTPLSVYALRPEDAQPFDPAQLPTTHQVGANESLYDIATRYQVPLRALIDQNQLEPPYAMSVGRELRLPPPRFHTVARGESFEDVARSYNVDLRSLALLNRMQRPYRVRQGERVVLPAMARAMPAPPAPPISTPRPRTSASAPIHGSGRFGWPLRGDVVARFGAQPGGVRLDGIEIAGSEGAPIAAAADGEVVYAGADLPAYGTLVLVRHADNYVTAYAFARQALVREGQRVRAGERIAELGPRDDGRPRLLFQVRQGAEAIDPAPLMAR
jgi:murein DD-endopeptidase MepM/ murein hydrolase activator NlpD